jgi:hypothetical protein
LTRDTDAEARALISTDQEMRDITKLYVDRRTAFMLTELDSRGLLPVYEKVANKSWPDLDWESVGVSEADIARASERGVTREWLHRVFCHREVVQDEPRALAYYRNLAGISAKAQGRTLPHLHRIETGSQGLIMNDLVREEMADLNDVLRGVLNDPLFDEKVIDPLLFVGEGASIDGVWRNVIGNIAVWQTARRLTGLLAAHDEFVEMRVTRTVDKRKETLQITSAENAVDEDHERERWIPQEITARCSVIGFLSNPDIEISRRGGPDEWTTIAAGEIKGATDPANVWERWPLVLKTLDDIKSTRPEARRFFIGLTMTENLALGLDRYGAETRRGIKQLLNEGLLDRGFGLGKLGLAGSSADMDKQFDDYFGRLILCEVP